MKNILIFILLCVVKLIAATAATLVLASFCAAFPNSPLMSLLAGWMADGNYDAFVSQAAIILSYLLTFILASKLKSKRPFIALCIFDVGIQLLSLVFNLIHQEWIWPNVVSLVVCGIAIHFAKSELD